MKIFFTSFLFICIATFAQDSKFKKSQYSLEEIDIDLGADKKSHLPPFYKISELRSTSYLSLLDSTYFWSYDTLANAWSHALVRTFHSYNLSNDKDSLLYQTWDSIQWKDYELTLYDYDSNHNVINELTAHLDSAGWNFFQQMQYTYDPNGNMITFTTQSGSNGIWNYANRYVYTYDSNNNKTSFLQQQWIANSWENIVIHNYYFDSNNNLISEEGMSWDGNSWINGALTTFIYDLNNNRLSEVRQYWDSLTWNNQRRIDYVYDANNNLIEETYKDWFSGWVVSEKYLHTYDINNNRTSTEKVAEYLQTFTYDSNNNNTSYLTQIWEPISGTWANSSLLNWSYDTKSNMTSYTFINWDGNSWKSEVNYNYTYDVADNKISDISQIWRNSAWLSIDSTHYYYTINSDVWPGDANNDLQVDNYDLLPIGLYYNETGSPRTTVSNVWQPEVCTNWDRIQNNGADLKHADCNGDGIVDSNDTLAIDLNFTQSHSFAPNTTDLRASESDFFITTNNSSYNPGDWVTADIWLGTQVNPVENLYGLAFDISYNSSLVQPGSENISFSNSWLLNGSNGLKIAKIGPVNSLIRLAQTRTDHLAINGYGHLGTIQFQLNNAIFSVDSIELDIVGYSAVDAQGNNLYFNVVPTAFEVTAGIEAPAEGDIISIYPNPFNESTQISYELRSESNVSIELFNALGQTIEVIENSIKQPGRYSAFVSPTLKCPDGVYFVKIRINDNTVMKKMIQIK
ncbi:MAG: T9SS type A sorting domain-containing protein [Bacteroidia bacterium]|nr:T9SS type A sorting domain-containing protein [Bacteroidia bacterium]